MGVQWTKDQKKVIDLRDRDILVSAAAGSGKTAVLVERILSLVTDPVHPVDIDRLLIMTFTRAAAAEMRTRLTQALEARLEEEPDNEHLQRQTTLIHNAQITTIHGFCGYVIQNYFHMLDLDPGYRVADAGECKLLMTDVAREVLEDAYAQKDEAYDHFVESYSTGKTDEGLEDLVIQLYEFVMSAPFPLECLEEWEKTYAPEDRKALEESPWMQLLWEKAGHYIEEALELARENVKLALEPDGPAVYEKALEADLEFLEKLSGLRDFDEMHQALAKPAWTRLPPVKDPMVSETVKERVKEGRQRVKDLTGELCGTFFAAPLDEVLQTMADCKSSVHVLTNLVRSFMEVYSQRKREKNLLDFSDMEHFALEILLRKEGDVLKMTQAAKELSLRYEEVMVDEYQDSNLVQEYLMNAVSGWAKEKKNTFMVGDVKQSIYRFRLARPELFMKKQKSYTLEDSSEQRVDLHKNFRSRPQVLDGINFLFRQIMGEDLGGVEYDEAAALYPGASFPETGQKEKAVEVLMVQTDGPGTEEIKGSRSEREMEALAIAGRIRELVGHAQVLDKKSGQYRPAEYGDVVVLLRTMEGWADTFAKVLGGQGIPAYTASKTGYFSALEVVTVLNFLRILDNPRQEIPYGAVLHSPIVGCTAQELALIRVSAPKLALYESVPAYAQEGEDGPLREKLSRFLDLMGELRETVPYTPIHEFIRNLLSRTGYQAYVSALPGGAQRQANLDMLVEKALDFEKTSYRGLFHFVRYIDSLQSYKVDFGEVNLAGGTDTVEIMSIHKSKGLEFPIVFVAGMGKNFNTQDLRNALVTHPDLGIGVDAVYPKLRARIPTLPKQMIKLQLKDENLGEELRVLYVALTRAKEKLILVGTVKDPQKRLASLQGMLGRETERLSYVMREGAKTYWDWILPALARHRDFAAVLETCKMAANPANPFYQAGPPMEIRVVELGNLLEEQMEWQLGAHFARERLQHWEEEPVEEAIREEISRRFAFSYPYADRREIPAKVSVSELKHQKPALDEESFSYYFEPDIVPLIPRFAADKQEEYTGAARGTAYHKVMECLDYTKVNTQEEIVGQIAQMTADQRMDEVTAACVRPQEILTFASSKLGQRMKAAALDGRLHREHPFVILQSAAKMKPQWSEEEEVLVQGIIDAYFWEGEEIVLVDYKTDKVLEGKEQTLIDRYQVQLESYGEALTALTGKRVKEIYIYSFTLQKAIPLSL
ncbi:MAG: helicase-exonuclease AddAB subunit AddA [Blautia sp.]|jgi:ATP-dependent helicase/nuclease subunit A